VVHAGKHAEESSDTHHNVKVRNNKTATSDELFKHPLHPYTKSLISAIPLPDPHYEKHRKRIVYNAALAHDYSVDKPSMQEVCPGHFVYCNSKEFADYQEEIKALDASAKEKAAAEMKVEAKKAEEAAAPKKEAAEKPAKKAASKKKTEKK
jgi:ABC-type glutathione transport system ATPase component